MSIINNKKLLIEFAMKEAHPECGADWTLTDSNFEKIVEVFTKESVDLDNYHLVDGLISCDVPTTGYQGHIIDACGDLWKIDAHTRRAIHEGCIIEPTPQTVEYYEDKNVAYARAAQLGAVGDDWNDVVKRCIAHDEPFCYNYQGDL